MDEEIKADLTAAWRRVQRLIEEYESRSGGRGQQELAAQAGVSQATISRLAQRPPKRIGGGFVRLFVYARKREVSIAKPDPRSSPELIAALSEVWNGTDVHAKALAAIIRAMADVARAANQ